MSGCAPQGEMVHSGNKKMRKKISKKIISWSLIGLAYLWHDGPRKRNLKLQVIDVNAK
jgi:hypothetical protein